MPQEQHVKNQSLANPMKVDLNKSQLDLKNKFSRDVIKTDLDPLYILNRLDELESKLYITRYNRGNCLFNY